MMCMVCMTLLTTCLFLTNSSVGSQLMIFDFGTLESLQSMPANNIALLFTCLYLELGLYPIFMSLLSLGKESLGGL